MRGIGAYARTTPDALAMIGFGKSITFAELDARQRALAGFLRSGLEDGDRIAVLSANRLEQLEVMIGALRAGLLPVPVSSLLAPPEVAYIVEDAGARWMFTDGQREFSGLERVVTFGDAYERCLHEADPGDISDHVLGRPMHYTSGTTGHPKGVWVPPYSEKRAAGVAQDFIRLWGLSSEDVHLVCSPLVHSAPLRFCTRTLEAGGKVTVQSRFDAEETLAAIEFFGVTTTFMVPTHLERIFALGRKALARHDLSSLRLLVHAGAPIREATKRDAIDTFPKGSVWEFYGATEGQATRISATEWLRKPGSVGTPNPGVEILITSEAGERLGPLELGEVWIRDPRADRFAYWGDKAKTRAAWRDDAFTVGDLGSVDDDGYLFLAGRKHDTIITGGVNVYPQEVERVLLDHPAVAEVSVYGAAHAEWGQEVRALVVPSPGLPLDAELLRKWARERLAGYKCPRVIELVDDLDRTPTGKIKRPT
jgi:long-chain acyl-CoA synthetase